MDVRTHTLTHKAVVTATTKQINPLLYPWQSNSTKSLFLAGIRPHTNYAHDLIHTQTIGTGTNINMPIKMKQSSQVKYIKQNY